MDAVVAESPAQPYKDRSAWLLAFGIVEILLGAFALLIAASVKVTTLLFSPPETAQMAPGPHVVDLVFGAGFYGVLAAFFFVAGIGSIQRRNWARVLMLVASVFWLVLGTSVSLFNIFLLPKLMDMQGKAAPATVHIEHIVMATLTLGIALFGVVLPLIFLVFYSRESVKAACLESDDVRVAPPLPGAPSPRRPPVPVLIVAFWEALGTMSVIVALTYPVHATVLFGFIVRGWTVIAIALVFSALSAAAAWLIYRMKFVGWVIALSNLLFYGLSAAISVANGSMDRLFLEISQISGHKQIFQLVPHFVRIMMVSSMILCAAYLALLIYTRRFFVPPRPPAAT